MRYATRVPMVGLVLTFAIALPPSWTWGARLVSAASSMAGAPPAADLFRAVARQQPANDPFQFLAPTIAVSAQDRANLDGDQVVARVLSGKGGQLAHDILRKKGTTSFRCARTVLRSLAW